MKTIITAQVRQVIETKHKLTKKEINEAVQNFQDAPIGQYIRYKSVQVIEKRIAQRHVKVKRK